MSISTVLAEQVGLKPFCPYKRGLQKKLNYVNLFSIMHPEKKPAVVIDSGSSIRPEDKITQELEITILPLDITFSENGKLVTYPDLDLSADEFYQKMAESKQLPTTSGAIPGRALEAYQKLSETTDSIISVHLTSKHSAAYPSALRAAQMAKEENPELTIEVIDSRQISLGIWLLAEMAARLSQQGATLEEIKQETLATIPKIETYAALATLKNIIAGGRVPALAGYLGMALKIKPVLKIIDGRLEEIAKIRTVRKARAEMVKMVEREEAEIVKMAVIHANDPASAWKVRRALNQFYSGEISVHEVGPVLGVHAGQGTVGIAFQKA
jgi:DegV family protein with EDD domain